LLAFKTFTMREIKIY